ncbi:hypothetical protein KY315_00990 [Candidatus Woesearchaeota archaeon]|nr:hypothetical protein [Candidatus Woesearchaeota archaeon]
MKNNNLIRKIILEEILKNIKKKQIINESPGAIALGAAGLAYLTAATGIISSYIDDPNGAKVDRVTTHTQQNNVYLVMKNMLADVENLVIISDGEANQLAKKLQTATSGGTNILSGQIFGMGTDEDLIKSTIEASKSQLGFAKVCVAFEKLTSKSFKDVYRGELAGGQAGDALGTDFFKDQENYVIQPILMLPFIILDVNGEEKGYSEDEFLALLEEAQNEEGAEDDEECSPPVGLETPYFTNAVKVMNAYAELKEIAGYTNGPVQETWDGAHQKCWELFVGHVFDNQTEFTGYKDSLTNGGKTWKEVSDVLRPDYPGYTYNKRGFLAFCLDAFCNEIKHGNAAPSSSSSRGRTGRSGGGTTAATPAGDITPAGRESGSNNFEIKLLGTGKNFENSGFGPSGIDRIVAEAVLSMRNQNAIRNGMPRTNMVLYIEINKAGNKVKGVEAIKGDGSLGPFKNRRRQINKGVMTALNSNELTFPSTGPYSGNRFDAPRKRRARGKFIRATITFFGGRY